uniref:Uncharacterized protein n=1 Tax=Rhizophora mucronata TaxID=61149 RepID=A0A2P2QE24_RHIMU
MVRIIVFQEIDLSLNLFKCKRMLFVKIPYNLEYVGLSFPHTHHYLLPTHMISF